MTTASMLEMFKTTAQVKGLDTYRFISDEDICVYINQAIINKVRAVVGQAAMVQYPGKSYINDNPISGTNILKSLHKQVTATLAEDDEDETVESEESFVKDYAYIFMNEVVMYITSLNLRYDSGYVTNCRIIDPDKFNLPDDDYCNDADYKHPICSYYKEVGDNGEIYNFKIKYSSREFPTAKIPDKLEIHYIATPTIISVKNLGDYEDIPDYAFPEIIDIAVNMYFRSVGATSQQLQQIETKQEND